MGAKYLLDTNVIIDFSSQKLPAKAYHNLSGIIDEFPQISVINKIELLSLSTVPAAIVQFAEGASVLPLDEKVVEKTIELRRKYRFKLPDAVIAATAIVFDLTLITHNIVDFKGVKNLKVIDSHFI